MSYDKDQATRALFDAGSLRVPELKDAGAVSAKVGKLEDYAIAAARTRGDLEEARLWMDQMLHGFTVKWAKMVGWESVLPGGKKRKDATKDDVTEAKRHSDPTLFENISDLKHLVSQLSAQIRRIEKDEDRVSRVYTFLTGN